MSWLWSFQSAQSMHIWKCALQFHSMLQLLTTVLLQQMRVIFSANSSIMNLVSMFWQKTSWSLTQFRFWASLTAQFMMTDHVRSVSLLIRNSRMHLYERSFIQLKMIVLQSWMKIFLQMSMMLMQAFFNIKSLSVLLLIDTFLCELDSIILKIMKCSWTVHSLLFKIQKKNTFFQN